MSVELQQQINTLNSQLEAHRGQLNETFQVGLHLRTNLVHAQKANQDLTQQVSTLTSELQTANAKIAELSSQSSAAVMD